MGSCVKDCSGNPFMEHSAIKDCNGNPDAAVTEWKLGHAMKKELGKENRVKTKENRALNNK